MNLEYARLNMIEQQIRPWAVLDQTTLDTLRFLPREKFVPPAWYKLAFADIEIPLGHGESMMHPRVEARMLQALRIQTDDQCLEIGTGSGFVTACMAQMSEHVDSIDLYRDFSKQAELNLAAQGITNFNLYTDDAAQGWNGLPGKHYDVIAVTGSVPEIAQAFEQRLAIGGRLFVVVGQRTAMHALLVTRDSEDEFSRKTLFETHLKPLTGSETPPSFHF